VRLNARRGSEQYHVTNSRIACSYGRCPGRSTVVAHRLLAPIRRHRGSPRRHAGPKRPVVPQLGLPWPAPTMFRWSDQLDVALEDREYKGDVEDRHKW